MISKIRKSIALAIAILVTVLTLGRMRVNWTGGPAAVEGAGDPGRAAVTDSYVGDTPQGET